MAVDDFDAEIKAVDERLVTLTQRIEQFEEASRVKMASTQNTVLSQLRDSVNAVNKTMLFLDQGEDMYIDTVVGPLSEAQSTKDVVKKHSTSMHESFSQLRETATSAVKQAEDVKSTLSEFDVQLDILRKDLDAIATRVESLYAIARLALGSMEEEIQNTERILEQKKGEIDSLEKELGNGNDDRRRLRKVAQRIHLQKSVAWASSIIFPPMVLRAVSLEFHASDLRARMRELKEQIKDEEPKTLSLLREKATLEGRKEILAAVVANTKALIARCEPLSSSASETQQLVETKIVEYHDLVLRADDLAAWTGDLTRQTNAFRLLGSSSRMQLQKSTARIVTRLLEMDQAEVKLITRGLKKE
ncbi:hypothetical protein ANO14919_103130 [Xylariales sp. No.14919]|nr:hypothetical protein ANO14919_103130 [Xylariales sp. No.14919]